MQTQPQGGCFFCCLPLAIFLSLGVAGLVGLLLLQLVR
jgi:hypothetical protein